MHDGKVVAVVLVVLVALTVVVLVDVVGVQLTSVAQSPQRVQHFSQACDELPPCVHVSSSCVHCASRQALRQIRSASWSPSHRSLQPS